MQPVDPQQAAAAAASLATSLGLEVDETVVLHDSNRLVVRLLPCDSVARVSPVGWFSPRRGVELARRLAAEAPGVVAGLDPRVEPVVHERDGCEIGLWTHFEAGLSRELSPGHYARALEQLHAALRRIDMPAPTFTDRLVEVQQWVIDGDATPDLAEEDRGLLGQRLEPSHRLQSRSARSDQLLHGEPHPWNVLHTADGPLFIDFENCARGPVEYDLAWAPAAVAERYVGVDQETLDECRGLVLAVVAAHRWHRDDRHPSGRPSGVAFIDLVRAGPPWPALDEVTW